MTRSRAMDLAALAMPAWWVELDARGRDTVIEANKAARDTFSSADLHAVEQMIGARSELDPGAHFTVPLTCDGTAFRLTVHSGSSPKTRLVTAEPIEVSEPSSMVRSANPQTVSCNIVDLPAMVHCLDAQGRIVNVSRMWLQQLGYRANKVIGQPIWALMPEAAGSDAWERLRSTIENGTDAVLVTEAFFKSDGTVIDVQFSAKAIYKADGTLDHIVGVITDFAAHRPSEAVLEHLASHDPLTGLANRRMLVAELDRARARAERSGRRFALMLLDLDHFKDINDTYGHVGGDELLCDVAQRLDATVRRTDFVCRLGGDEFAILVSEQKDALAFATLAERILARLREPFLLGGDEVGIGASIGVSIYPDDGRSDDDLIQNADMALYSAKKSGRQTWRVFSRMMHQAAQARSRLHADLKGAWERDEFFLTYQPVLDLESLEIDAVEALLRWRHAERGLIHAGQFVAALERSGDIVALTTWVIARASEQHREWAAADCAVPRLSINLPAQFLIKPELGTQLRKELEQAHIPLNCLILEFSEAAYASIHEVPQPLLDLREAGAALAIDNFGGGGIALTKIGDMAIDVLKLDRSFLRSPLASKRDRAMLNGIAKLARGLGRQAVAKGIETRMQVHHLRKMGFHGGQGYVFSRPLNGADVPDWSANWRRQLPLDNAFRQTA